jgi:hypothetical protein
MPKLADGSPEYKRWRKFAAREFKCSQAGIDEAVQDGTKGYMAALKAQNPMALMWRQVYRESLMPMYFVGFQWWMYHENPTLRLLMDAVHTGESPFTQPVEKTDGH